MANNDDDDRRYDGNIGFGIEQAHKLTFEESIAPLTKAEVLRSFVYETIGVTSDRASKPARSSLPPVLGARPLAAVGAVGAIGDYRAHDFGRVIRTAKRLHLLTSDMLTFFKAHDHQQLLMERLRKGRETHLTIHNFSYSIDEQPFQSDDSVVPGIIFKHIFKPIYLAPVGQLEETALYKAGKLSLVAVSDLIASPNFQMCTDEFALSAIAPERDGDRRALVYLPGDERHSIYGAIRRRLETGVKGKSVRNIHRGFTDIFAARIAVLEKDPGVPLM